MSGYEIIRKEDTETMCWSGGTTRELLIYPEKSHYKSKDFLFRLSVATIEVPTSEFTPLEGIRRTTLILDGTIELTHRGHYSKKLESLEQDSYDGGWQTDCRGMCSDFNLMLRENTQGSVRIVDWDNLKDLSFQQNRKYLIYVHEGSLIFDGEMLKKEDAVYVEANAPKLNLESVDAKLVVCEIETNS